MKEMLQLKPDLLLHKRLKSLSLSILVGMTLVCLLTLLGWATGSEILKYPVSGTVAMNPLTAISFLALIISFYIQVNATVKKVLRYISWVLTVLIVTIVLWKLSSLIFDFRFSLDQQMFSKAIQNEKVDGFANSMAPNTAFSFVVCGITVLFYNAKLNALRIAVQSAVVVCLLLSVFSLLGYLFGATEFYEVKKFIPMAPVTAVCFFLFGLSILFAAPGKGIMQQLTSVYTGSYMAWRLFIPAVLLPVFMGVIRLKGQKEGLYNLEFGSALFVTSIILVFLALIWLNTLLLNKREQKQEETLSEKKHLANLVQQTSDGILSTDPYLNIQSWNKGAEEMYGFKREEVIGKPLGKFLRSTLTPEVTEKLMHELNEKGFYTAEYEFYGKQEEPVHVLASVTVLRNSEAEVSGYVAVHRDISERRKLEENLQQFNRKLEIQVEEKTQELRSVFERISDAFLGIDNNGIIVYSNRKAEELFGNAGVQLLNSSVKRLFSQTDGEVETALQEAFTNREYIYLETWIPQFARWFEMHIYPSSSGLSVYLRDITIRKIAQRELNASEEKYRLFFENSMDGILLTNANGIIFSANKAACEIFGMTEEEICSGGRSKILDESDPNWPVFFEERNINGKAQGELRHFRKDGSVFPAEITSVKFSTASGEEQTNTIIRDITDRKKAQDQLQKEKDLSDSIINTLPGIFYFCDRNGKFIRWNKKYNDVTGYSNEEIARMNPLDFFEESERAYVYARIKEAFVNGISDAEASLVTKSGKRICYYFTGARIDVDGEMFALGMGIDITDRKRAEQDVNESYLQIRRLTAYLQNIREEERANIAREIHDELGQQLTVMKMDVAWMRKRLSSGDTEAVNNKLNELLDLLDGTVASVRRISTELRPSLLDDIGLIAAAEWQAEVVAKRSGLKINIHKEGENLAVQEVFATGLFRILQESLTNITRHANASQVDIHLKNRNNEFILCVEDNGRGFDVNSLTGKKTLGLLGIKERSVAMQGTFTITSAPGKGTKVEVKVPFV